jgi:hypothetical protein
MTVAILGDLSLSKMVKSQEFKAQLAVDFASYQVSSMPTLLQYNLLMPQGVKYVVVGCLGPLLLELQYSPEENRQITLSMPEN